jgi:hypothetical protein
MDRPLITTILARALQQGFQLAPRCTLDGYPIVYRTETRGAYEVLKEIYVITEDSRTWFQAPGQPPDSALPAGSTSTVLQDVLDYFASRNAK